MRTKLVLMLCVLFVMLAVLPANAQSNYVDMTPTKHITQAFMKALSDKNIEVWRTYQCGSNYRKDWTSGTYMRLTGKGFVWTDGQGVVHLHMFTMNPPMSLEGFRPPMTLNTAPWDSDGNIVVGDPDYWIRYRLWQTRPCVDLTDALYHNRNLASAWNYLIAQSADAHKYAMQWSALGLDSSGKVPGVYNEVAAAQLESPVFEPVAWEYTKGMGYDTSWDVKEQLNELPTLLVVLIAATILLLLLAGIKVVV